MQGCPHDHTNLSDRVYVAAALIEMLREFIALELACATKGETLPTQIETCIRLMKGVLEKEYPEITWKEAIVASQTLR